MARAGSTAPSTAVVVPPSSEEEQLVCGVMCRSLNSKETDARRWCWKNAKTLKKGLEVSEHLANEQATLEPGASMDFQSPPTLMLPPTPSPDDDTYVVFELY